MPCGSLEDNNSANSSSVDNEVKAFIQNTYPKNKILPLVFNILLKKELIEDTLFFTHFPRIHVADFSAFILNRFKDDTKKIDTHMLGFLKYLNKLGVKFPKICIKNPRAQKYIT